MNSIARIAPQAETLADGIYFGIDDATYHALPRLSASGIKNLLVSPMDFWARSWLNPTPRSEDDEPEWATKGKAYHCRICEGRTAFYSRYVKGCEASDYPGCLETNADLKAECAEMGLKVSGNKDELIERLLGAGCTKPIWEVLVDAYREQHSGKTFIPSDWIYDIELAAACIENSPNLAKCFQGGHAEVAILWTAEIERNDGSGELFTVPMKMKCDYLKPAAIVDLKTLANKMMKPIDRAVYYDMASHRYHIQSAVYYAGLKASAGLPVNVVSGDGPSRAWLDALAKNEKQFVFVYQQKGIAPVASGYVMPANLGLISVGEAQVREAQQDFHDCMERFGALPWITDRPIQQVGDGDVPNFATE